MGYRSGDQSADWAKKALLVADLPDTYEFEAASARVKSALLGSLEVREVFRGPMGDTAAHSTLLQMLNEGNLLVVYNGHGSVDLWRGHLLSSEDARTLSNGTKLPLFLSWTCLNGYFADVYSESLAETLMKSEGGGAIGVWASSGLTDPWEQEALSLEASRYLLQRNMTVGEAILRAKAATQNSDVIRTWTYLGDPTLKLLSGGAVGASCDITGDGSMNVLDLQLLVNAVMGGMACPGCDINRDSTVNVLDLQALVNVILGIHGCP
jgi:hypothetical protein